jgi:hypothetical protein
MMDRRKTMMVGGGVLAAAVAVGALAGSIGIFGLSDDPPRVGKLSPIDATHSTTGDDPDADTSATTSATTPTTGAGATAATTATTVGASPTTTVTAPSVDDHGGDDHDNSGPGSSNSGRDDDGDSGSGRDHPEDD